MLPFHMCSCLGVPAACIQVNPRMRAFGYDEYWEIIYYHVQITDDSHLKATTFIPATRIHHPTSEDRLKIQQLATQDLTMAENSLFIEKTSFCGQLPSGDQGLVRMCGGALHAS